MAKKKRTGSSGNPARRAASTPETTPPEQSARQQKVAEYQRNLARRRRSTALWWTLGSVVAIGVIVAIAASYFLSPARMAASYNEGGTGAEIDGVQVFDLATNHVDGDLDYDTSPPAGGTHNNAWLNCGVYDQEQRPENAVHSMEHGAVWLSYDPSQVDADGVATLRTLMPSSYAILSPLSDQGDPVVVTAWNHQLRLDSVDDPRIAQFFEEYWRNQNVPEPGAMCTGAIDGPGKIG